MHWIVGLLFFAVGPFEYPLGLLGPTGTDAVVVEGQEAWLVLEDGVCSIRLVASVRVRPTSDGTCALRLPAWKAVDARSRSPETTLAGGGPAIGPPGPPVAEPARYRPVEVRVDGVVVSTTLVDSVWHEFEIALQPPRLVKVEVETRIDSILVRSKSLLEKRHFRVGTSTGGAWLAPAGERVVLPQDGMSIHVDTRWLKVESIASVHPLPEGSDTETQWTWIVLPRESTVFEIVVAEFGSVAEFVDARHASPRSWHEAWRLAYACNLVTNQPRLVREIIEKGIETMPESFDRRAQVRAVLLYQLALAENALPDDPASTEHAATLAEEALAEVSGRSIEALRRSELFRGAAHALEESFARGERMGPWNDLDWAISVLTALVEENDPRAQPLGTGRKR